MHFVVADGKKAKIKNRKQKTDCKTYTHSRHTIGAGAEIMLQHMTDTCSPQQLHSEQFPTCRTSASSHRRICETHPPDAVDLTNLRPEDK